MENEIRKYLDEIYNESITLPENFGESIVTEVKDRFVEDGYEVTKQMVLEEMLWCYMSKMQWNGNFKRKGIQTCLILLQKNTKIELKN